MTKGLVRWFKEGYTPLHSNAGLRIAAQCGAIAQLGERLNGIQEVVGSIPIGSTKSDLKHLVKMISL